MQTWALIVDSFRHTLDRKIFWVMIGVSVVVAAAMACVSFDETGATVFFKWHWDDPELHAGTETQRALVTQILIYYLADKFIGFVGILLALISTAGIFPAMMESGAVDVVLGKPLSRTKLFLGKYLGSMTFVAVQAGVFVLLTFVVAGLRWKQWLWAYFWTIPLFVVLFSYLYVFCVFFAVSMRSSVGPLLMTLICWVVVFGVQSADSVVQVLPMVSQDGSLARATRLVRWLVPRTQDMPHIAARLIDPHIADAVVRQARSHGTTDPASDPDAMERMLEGTKRIMSFSIPASLASSLGIEVVFLVLAVWRFSRRDF